jgi:hypothetical protein
MSHALSGGSGGLAPDIDRIDIIMNVKPSAA